LNINIIEGIRVDDGDVLLNRGVFGFIYVTVDSWDSEENIVRADSTSDKSLNESISMERAAIDNTSSLTAFISKSLH
jgi:hypothetical protein